MKGWRAPGPPPPPSRGHKRLAPGQWGAWTGGESHSGGSAPPRPAFPPPRRGAQLQHAVGGPFGQCSTTPPAMLSMSDFAAVSATVSREREQSRPFDEAKRAALAEGRCRACGLSRGGAACVREYEGSWRCYGRALFGEGLTAAHISHHRREALSTIRFARCAVWR